MFKKKQLGKSFLNLSRSRRYSKPAFAFFDDCIVDVKEGDEAYVALKVKTIGDIPKDDVIFSKSRIGSLATILASLNEEIQSLKETVNDLKEGQSILLNQYLTLNLPQFLENCASRVLRDHNPEMETALGRLNRMEIQKGHPNSCFSRKAGSKLRFLRLVNF
jgi:hypothetical protein